MPPTAHNLGVKTSAQTLYALLQDYGDLTKVSPRRVAADLGVRSTTAWRRMRAAQIVEGLLRYSAPFADSPVAERPREKLKAIRHVAPMRLLETRVPDIAKQWEAFVLACNSCHVPGGREITAAIAAVTGKPWEEVAAPADRNRRSAARLLKGLINHLTEKRAISPKSLRNCIWQLHEIGRLLHLRLEDER